MCGVLRDTIYIVSIPSLTPRTKRIAGALAVALLLIGGAYVVSGPSIFSSKLVTAESTEELLKIFAAKDTDTDGLPDWQEALYGTDAGNPHSFSATLTDGEAFDQGLLKPKFETDTSGLSPDLPDIEGIDAAPGTITDTFARTFFDNYMKSRDGLPPDEAELNTFIQDALKDLANSQRANVPYSIANVRVSGQGADAVRSYAAALEAAFAANTARVERNELYYFTDAVQKDDKQALKTVRTIATAYKNISAAVIKVPVPAEAQAAHLKIANTIAYMGVVTGNLGAIDADPLRGMLGMIEYKTAADAMIASFMELNAVFTNQGIVIQEGESGYSIYRTSNKAAE